MADTSTQAQGAALGGVTAAFTPTNAAQAAALAQVNQAFAPTPISATGLQTTQTPANIPTPAQTNYGSALASGNAILGANTASLATPATVTSSTDPYALLQSYLSGSTPPPSAQTTRDSVYGVNDANLAPFQQTANQDAAAVKAAQASLAATTAQIQGITAEGTGQKLLQENTFGTTGNTIGQQAQIDRNQAVKAIPLQIQALAQQAQVAAAQGNAQLSQSILTQAQQHLDTVYQVHQQDATNQYNYLTSLRNSVFQFATTQQQNQLAAAQKANDQAFTTQQNNLNYAQGLATSAISNGQPTIASKILALDPTSKTYRADVAKLSTGIAPKTNAADNLQFVAATATQPAGTFNKQTGVFTPIASTASGQTPADVKNLTTVNDINSILSSPAFDSTFGVYQTLNRNFPGTDAYKLSSDVNNLVSNLALAARGQMKGQGAVSDFEGKMLRDAQTALKLNMSPEQAKQELIKVKGAIMTSSGLAAPVKITAPDGTVKYGNADQGTITGAISSGYTVEYQ